MVVAALYHADARDASQTGGCTRVHHVPVLLVLWCNVVGFCCCEVLHQDVEQTYPGVREFNARSRASGNYAVRAERRTAAVTSRARLCVETIRMPRYAS